MTSDFFARPSRECNGTHQFILHGLGGFWPVMPTTICVCRALAPPCRHTDGVNRNLHKTYLWPTLLRQTSSPTLPPRVSLQASPKIACNLYKQTATITWTQDTWSNLPAKYTCYAVHHTRPNVYRTRLLTRNAMLQPKAYRYRNLLPCGLQNRNWYNDISYRHLLRSYKYRTRPSVPLWSTPISTVWTCGSSHADYVAFLRTNLNVLVCWLSARKGVRCACAGCIIYVQSTCLLTCSPRSPELTRSRCWNLSLVATGRSHPTCVCGKALVWFRNSPKALNCMCCLSRLEIFFNRPNCLMGSATQSRITPSDLSAGEVFRCLRMKVWQWVFGPTGHNTALSLPSSSSLHCFLPSLLLQYAVKCAIGAIYLRMSGSFSSADSWGSRSLQGDRCQLIDLARRLNLG